MSGKDDENDDFAIALRAAIQARGLSLERLRYHLLHRGHELSVATISYWQSGRSRPERTASLAALSALESILELEHGALSGKLPARRRQTGPGIAIRPEFAFRCYGPAVEDEVARMGLSWDSGVHRVAVHDRVEIGPDAAQTRHTVREVLVGEREGADRYPLVYRASPDSPVRVQTLRHCQVGRSTYLADEGIVVAELLLDRPVPVGEAMFIEHSLNWTSTGRDDSSVARGFVRSVHSAHTEVSFHASCLPLSAERFTVVDGSQQIEPVVISGHSLHTLVLDFGPGIYGLRWTW
ncbi:hypothetical protein SAMN05421595_1937 [Austwickia chelonae]|uniref:Uncharacterized protein n=1 Tax=Austwickia chelonae NBRC 105200 TaxID=1184607 RepID=K6V3V8_9MICO|nr:hypothetical protein [Austwickia chelonae]GAB76803.1 hypothetical protein AUCHE_03_00200 [Austwickia chelonae NBRC 105200]SEW30918.1 hypothetical protein SAMN05421595_1937 [Austwickia chelonae]